MSPLYTAAFSLFVAVGVGALAAWLGSLANPVSSEEFLSQVIRTSATLLTVPLLLWAMAPFSENGKIVPKHILFRNLRNFRVINE